MYSDCVCRCLYLKAEEGRARPAMKLNQLLSQDNLLL